MQYTNGTRPLLSFVQAPLRRIVCVILLLTAGDATAQVISAADPNADRYRGLTLESWMQQLDEEPLSIELCEAIEYFGPSAARYSDEFLKQSQSDNPMIRRYAAKAIGDIGRPRDAVIQALAKCLADDDRGVRNAAIRSLGKLAPTDEELVEPLVDAMDEPLREYRRQREQASKARPAPSLSDDLRKRLYPRGSLVASRVEELPMAVGSSTFNEVTAIAHTLGSMGPAARQAVPRLEELAGDEQLACPSPFFAALARIDPANEAYLQPLLAALDSNKSSSRFAAASALGELSTARTTAALPKLKRLLTDSDECVRQIAAQVVGRIEPTNRQAITVLIESLENSNQSREAAKAVDILARMKGLSESDVAALQKHVNSSDPYLRRAVRKALDSIESVKPDE